jgi:hypothetical protein
MIMVVMGAFFLDFIYFKRSNNAMVDGMALLEVIDQYNTTSIP